MNYRITAAYLLLVALIIPWYWPSGIVCYVFGVPLWALVSLFFGLLAAILTAWLFLREAPDKRNRDDIHE